MGETNAPRSDGDESIDTKAASIDIVARGDGIDVVDPIERRQFSLHATVPEATPIDDDPFDVPVDTAVEIVVDRLTIDRIVDVTVRDVSTREPTIVQPAMDVDFPASEYVIELHAPIKLYLHVECALEVRARFESIQFAFAEEAVVTVGARSLHGRPAATLTATEDPDDVRVALSYLSSALKTTSCERSYPTLRGHPPTIELGDELAIPAGLDRPETGIALELPVEFRSLFVAAPLAYYLGADIRPASRPRLVTESGFVHDLDADDGLETAIERVLTQVFFLDCLTRTEGIYRVTLHEREQVEPHVELDFSAVYELEPSSQLEAYLDVPFDAIAPHVPTWGATAFVDAEPANVTAIPFVVDELALIRPADGRRPSPSEVRTSVVEPFISGGYREDRETRAGDETRAADGSPARVYRSSDLESGRSAGAAPEQPQFVLAPESDSIERAWFGPDVPLNASKAIPQAFRNKLDRESTGGPIDITIVCNDDAMDATHEVVGWLDGARERVPFDVSIQRDLTVSELQRTLSAETDFLHYVGHIDDGGFVCADGRLDVRSLESVRVAAFLLNACQSYEQGMALIEAGAIAGVVTFGDVINESAIEMGHAMARLLNLGFPLRAALRLARAESIVGGQYIVVGDGSVDVAQVENGFAGFWEIEPVGGDRFDLTIYTFLPHEGGMGSLAHPLLESVDQHYLAPGRLDTFRVSESVVRRCLRRYQFPVRVGEELVWSEQVDELELLT